MENVDMYCFQVDDIFKQIDKVPSDCRFKKLGSTFRTWEDTACAVQCMDLMITTDNGILNLAGALGKKTFGIFNSMSEWRWIDTKGENVKWYSSVKPFACDTTNNWTYAMNNVAEEVKKLL
jgi:ADP-heptose:LPS heptosyltransferase